MGADNTIFDDVFRTIVEKMPQMIIPLINEVFCTTYPENAKIIQLRNEYQKEDGRIIADSHFEIQERIYHIECQSTSDGSMILRMVQYDFHIALEQARLDGGIYYMNFPHSCVLYLRHTKNTPNALRMRIHFPDGGKKEYRVPVVKVQSYSREEIFRKNLLLLLPFYIIRYEKEAKKIEKSSEKLKALLGEYENIIIRLHRRLSGQAKEFADMVDLIKRIADYIFSDCEKVKEGLGDFMGGKVLELQTDRWIREGMEKGIEKGIEKGLEKGRQGKLREIVEKKARKGQTAEEIAEDLLESVDTINGILAEIMVKN